MTKITHALTAAALALGASTAANAIDFVFDNDGSSVSVNGTPSCAFGSCSLTADLLTPFVNQTVTVGSPATFDFARFTIGGGIGGDLDASVAATLAFELPDVADSTASGNAAYGTIFGIVSGGSLIWNDGAGTTYNLANGASFNVDFVDILAGGFGNSATAQVRITALSEGTPDIGAGVPEPATWAMLVLGFGLVGMGARRRRSTLVAA